VFPSSELAFCVLCFENKLLSLRLLMKNLPTYRFGLQIALFLVALLVLFAKTTEPSYLFDSEKISLSNTAAEDQQEDDYPVFAKQEITQSLLKISFSDIANTQPADSPYLCFSTLAHQTFARPCVFFPFSASKHFKALFCCIIAPNAP
jgi:hypothetical protein